MARLEIGAEIEIMRAAGLQDDEIARLAGLRKRVGTGEVDDLTIEYKRLMFLKFLCNTGRVGDVETTVTPPTYIPSITSPEAILGSSINPNEQQPL